MLIDGKVQNIRTKSKAENEGNVRHITTVTAEFEDLDRSVLEEIAFAEHFGRFLTMELHAQKVPTTIGRA
jgi:hypothetical protein